jgi:hypothetical protein
MWAFSGQYEAILAENRYQIAKTYRQVLDKITLRTKIFLFI